MAGVTPGVTPQPWNLVEALLLKEPTLTQTRAGQDGLDFDQVSTGYTHLHLSRALGPSSLACGA